MASTRYAPLDAALFASNRERLTQLLPAGALAIFNSNDVMPTNADGSMNFRQNNDLYYLSGVDQEESVLLLFPGARDPKRREILFVRETSELIAVWEGDKLDKSAARAVSGIETVRWTRDLPQVLRELALEADAIYLNQNEHARATIAVETRDARFLQTIQRDFPLHQLGRLAPLMHRLRMIKSAPEIEAMQIASDTTAAGFARLLQFIEPGVTEYQIEAELLHQYTRGRSRGFAYQPILASGKNACVLHYVENNATLQDGELILMDVAAEYANYNSDMTRTIPVSGRFTPRQRAVYDAVLRVLRACNQRLKPGVTLKNYQRQAESLIEDELVGLGLITAEQKRDQSDVRDVRDLDEPPAFRKYFMHGVSHHIGLDVHDVSDPSAPLAPGMVLTIEPGIYIRDENIGIRLENIVVIGADGNRDLMENVPLEADDIEAAMNAR